MPNYVVLKTSNNAVPNPGTVGSADMYFGDHADLPSAINAAAGMWRLGPGQYLWGDLASNFIRYITTVGSTPA